MHTVKYEASTVDLDIYIETLRVSLFGYVYVVGGRCVGI